MSRRALDGVDIEIRHIWASANSQADFTTGEEAAAKKASRSFKKYTYRGVELDQLLDMSNESFIEVS
jgi:hypothetical protein